MEGFADDKTLWPSEAAAQPGTDKIIGDHKMIQAIMDTLLVATTDGLICWYQLWQTSRGY